MEQGKKVCNELKAVRQQIADANGIEYSPAVCDHKGDCDGTCPACEQEVRYLEDQLNLRRMLGKAVIVAGLGLSVASCKSPKQVHMTGIVPMENIENSTQAAVKDSTCTVTDNEATVIRGKMVTKKPTEPEK